MGSHTCSRFSCICPPNMGSHTFSKLSWTYPTNVGSHICSRLSSTYLRIIVGFQGKYRMPFQVILHLPQKFRILYLLPCPGKRNRIPKQELSPAPPAEPTKIHTTGDFYQGSPKIPFQRQHRCKNPLKLRPVNPQLNPSLAQIPVFGAKTPFLAQPELEYLEHPHPLHHQQGPAPPWGGFG